jgi:MFS family permease
LEEDEQVPQTEEEKLLSASEADLRELEDRLDKAREPEGSGNKQFARGLALVASLGFVLAGCLIAGLMVGEYLVDKTGYRIFQLLGALFGLFTAFFAGAKLMKPLMKSED